MRERLVAALLGLTLAVIATYGVPRAYYLADLVREQARSSVIRSTDLVAQLVGQRVDARDAVTDEWLGSLLGEGEGIIYRPAAGPTVSAGIPATGDDAGIAVSRSVAGGGTVTLTLESRLVNQRVSQALLPLVLIGLALVVLSVLLAVELARRLSRPFQELATAARRLGAGDFDLDVRRYSVPEAEAIGEALRSGAAQLDALVRRDREFAVKASHELLTPIAGIRLELEDLTRWPQTAPEVASEIHHSLASLDLLAQRVNGVLEGDRERRHAASSDVDLTEVARLVAERWRPVVEAAGRRLVVVPGGPVVGHLEERVARQLLDLLVQQAHERGVGTITVETTELPTHLGVRVSDEGSRRSASDVVHRRGDETEGDALSLAAEVAESVGGRVRVADEAQSEVVLMLPRAESQ